MDNPPPFLDVSAPFGLCTPLDAKLVIDFLNANAGPQGEGEADVSTSSASGSDADVSSLLYASSSIVMESRGAGDTTVSRSEVDDQLFASDNLNFSERAAAPIAAYDPDVEDDRETAGKESWDQAVEEFDLGLLD
jgi:hypothetical protein